MKNILPILPIVFLVSCKQKLPPRLYETSNEITGGFNSFVLQLKTNGQLEMQLLTSKTLSATNAGNMVETPTLTLQGVWTLKNDSIVYTIQSPDSALGNFVTANDYASTFKSKPLLVFSKNQDTAFILGVPAALTTQKGDNE